MIWYVCICERILRTELMNTSITPHIYFFGGVRIFKFCFLSEFQLYNIVLISFGHQCYTFKSSDLIDLTTETLYLLTSLCLLPYLSQTQAATILLLEFNYFFFF